MSHCPCGVATPYTLCCGKYHLSLSAPTPEALMRSRYTAYYLGNIDYIKQTMRGKPLINFSADTGQNIAWLGLDVIKSMQISDVVGEVEFIARYLESGMIKSMHEISLFHWFDGRWFYVDGTMQNSHLSKPKRIARNAACPCGSMKKFKNCHDKKQ